MHQGLQANFHRVIGGWGRITRVPDISYDLHETPKFKINKQLKVYLYV